MGGGTAPYAAISLAETCVPHVSAAQYAATPNAATSPDVRSHVSVLATPRHYCAPPFHTPCVTARAPGATYDNRR